MIGTTNIHNYFYIPTCRGPGSVCAQRMRQPAHWTKAELGVYLHHGSPGQGLITIGLPVYNAMPYLPEAIESLLAQSVGDFEILAIVDGGTDDSLEYLRSVRDPRLRILVQSNAGVAATLNRMLHETRTPWLVRQDADDISYPTRIASLLKKISLYPQAGMVYSRAEYHPRERSVGRFRSTQGTVEQRKRLVKAGYLLSICHSTVALNVRKTLALGGYRRGLHAEDADLWWRMALAHEIHFVPDVLVGFRQNAGSVSSRHLYPQEIHGLYIQYLLLSHLLNYTESPLEELAPLLEKMIPLADLRAKEYLRFFNIHLAQKRYPAAICRLFQSLLTSPSYLARRLKDEFFPPNLIANGRPPEEFLRRKERFWPLQFCQTASNRLTLEKKLPQPPWLCPITPSSSQAAPQSAPLARSR